MKKGKIIQCESKEVQEEMKTYIVPVSWSMFDTVEIEARNAVEAGELVEDGGIDAVEGIYDDNFGVDYDGIEEVEKNT